MDSLLLELQNLKNKKKPHAADGLEMFIKMLSQGDKVLDVGSGSNEHHSKIIRLAGFQSDTCDFHESATYKGNFNTLDIPQYDAIWVSHCLEHQLNVNNFLNKIHSTVKENGLICITVPPLKSLIVGGHVSLWNPGLLIYNLVVAGFDCKDLKIKKYGYNISAIVRKKSFKMPQLTYDSADLKILKDYFPKNLEWNGTKHKFFGDIESLNWD